MSEQANVKVRVGIAGLGRSGWGIHAKLLEQVKEKYMVTAVFDPLAERRAEAVEKFGCRAYASFEEVLADRDVELVVVASPSHFHANHAIAVLEAGKHVVVEKPMATTLADADRMVAAGKAAAGQVFSIFQNRRYEPMFLKLMEIIQSGKLGRIVEIKLTSHGFARRWDWQTLQKFGGGQLRNNGPHMLDQALCLLGPGMPKQIFCHREGVLASGDAEDQVKIVLRMPSGTMLDMEMSSACAYPQERWLIMGSQGSLTSRGKDLVWKFFDPAALPPRPLDERPTPDRSYNREDIPWQEESWTPEPGANWERFYHDIYESIRNGAPVVVKPEEVRRQIAIMEESIRQSPLEQKYF